MRILQICNKIPFPPKDGGSIAIYNLARGLANEGHDVDILAMETPKHTFIKSNKKLHDKVTLQTVFVDTNIKSVKLIKNLLFSYKPYIAERFYSKTFESKLISILEANTYDVVQIEGLYVLIYAKLIREHSTAKISYRSHNIENEIWHRLYSKETSFIKKMYLKILAKRILKLEKNTINQYDLLVPITYRDAVEYQKFGNKKPHKVIQTGIPTEEIATSLKVRKNRKLYFLGSLEWLPNQEGVLWFVNNVWPMISLSQSNLEFHIAGRQAPPWFNKAVHKPGIFFHGEIENANDFVDEYDIMIVPILSGGGMRVKIVEAMSQGKIVVTTTIGAEGLDIIPNYHAVVADNPYDFATGVQILLENTDFFIKLGENSLRFIRTNYTNIALAKELINFYQTII